MYLRVAHVFGVLSREVEIGCKMMEGNFRMHEDGIIWTDPSIHIHWSAKQSMISNKDAKFSSLMKDENNFVYHMEEEW